MKLVSILANEQKHQKKNPQKTVKFTDLKLREHI